MRPLLLLDVDGVLCRTYTEPLPEGCSLVDLDGDTVVYDPPIERRLQTLQQLYDLVWCTLWEEEANVAISPLYRLPRLPVLTFSETDTWKLPAVNAYVGDRAVAWIDDEFDDQSFVWADARTEPTLLLPVASRNGLDNQALQRLLSFSAALSNADA